MSSYLLPSNTYAGTTPLFSGGNPSTWSTYEAISNVNINEYNLSNIDILDAIEIMAVSTFSSNILVENINAGNIVSSNLNVLNIHAGNIVSGNISSSFINSINSVSGNLNVININSGNIATSNITTLTGNMIMKDENGHNNLLHAVSSNLFFNNELLAKAGDVQNVADWALYAAVADIDADNRPIINAISIDTSSTIKSSLNIGDVNADSVNIGITNTATTNVFNLEAKNHVKPNEIVDTASGSIGNTGQLLTKNNNNILAWADATAPPIQNAVTSLNNLANAVVLTSTDNSITITPAGQNINLAANTGGSVANWSTYGAVSDVNFNNYTIKAGILPITADNGTSTDPSTVRISTFNGLYGKIDLTANSGQIAGLPGNSGGLITLTANGGNNVLTGDHGRVAITANAGTAGTLSTGGLVEITANSGFNDVTLTSAIKLSAAGINSYAGAIPTIGSLAGYNFIYGTGGVNISAGLPQAFPNFPGSVFIYGTTGVEVMNTLYAQTIRPYWNGSDISATNLTIQGRATPAALVNLRDINYMYMGGDGAITGITSINGQPFSNPPLPTTATGTASPQAADWGNASFTYLVPVTVGQTVTVNSIVMATLTVPDQPNDQSVWLVSCKTTNAGAINFVMASNITDNSELVLSWFISKF
jgi:hypothetical protein